jgi:hypothetical protein
MRLSLLTLTITSLTLLACKPDGGDTGESAGSTGGDTDTASSGATDSTDPTTGGESSSATGSASVASIDTGDPSDPSSSDPSDDTGDTGDTGTDSATEETGLADGCDALGPEQCKEDPACMPVIGQSEDFPGCMPGPQFLGCIDAIGCDDVLLTVCKDGTKESYRLPSGCFPPGFTPCDGLGKQCGGEAQCELLGEDACKAQGCTPITGAPHIVKDGGMCADWNNLEFIGCLGPDVACPPFVPTLCPIGMKEPAWDVPSGCIPAGLEECGVLLPECM